MLWKEAFRPSLLRHLSNLSQRAEVKIPSGFTLPALAGGGVVTAAAARATAEPSQQLGLDLSDEKKGAEELASVLGDDGGGQENEGKAPLHSSVVEDLRAATTGASAGRRGFSSPGPGWNGGVAGVLPAAGARRSFLRRATSR